MRVSKMRDVTTAKIPSLCGTIWRTILNFYASQGVWVNCYHIHQKSLNFIYPFKFYSNFTNKNVSWLHFSWATQYVCMYVCIMQQALQPVVGPLHYASAPASGDIHNLESRKFVYVTLAPNYSTSFLWLSISLSITYGIIKTELYIQII